MPKNEYVQEVLQKLQNNPTAQDIDYFIEAHARIGYLAAQAQGIADQRTIDRKYVFATRFAEAKQQGVKVSAAEAEQYAIMNSTVEARDEVKANETAAKLKNLLDSVEQAINGIKFLGRATDVSLPNTRR